MEGFTSRKQKDLPPPGQAAEAGEQRALPPCCKAESLPVFPSAVAPSSAGLRLCLSPISLSMQVLARQLLP